MSYAPPEVTFDVVGTPAPGGSKSSFWNEAAQKRVIVDSGGKRNRDWRACVRFAAIEAMDGAAPMRGPVSLEIAFRMRRPAHHHLGDDRSRPLRDSAPEWHMQTPDTTKLIRSTEDALVRVAWVDDKQVVRQTALKRWADPGERAGALVTIRRLASVAAVVGPLFAG